MKVNPWIYPGAALLLAGAWIATQKQSAAGIEHEISVITERIRQVRAATDAESAAHDADEKARVEKERKIDWKGMAAKISEMRNGGIQDMRAMMRMQRLIMDMTAAELASQLDEIAALDISDEVRNQLRSMVLGALAEKDPQLAIERSADYLQNDRSGGSWQIANALRKWADKDPAAAVAWLDKQIADGKLDSKSLDGRNSALVQYEKSVVSALLKTDVAAATARVVVLTDEQREQFFQQDIFQIDKTTEAAYSKLARDTMPSDKIGNILATMASGLAASGGYERVDGFIASSHATDEEKKLIVNRAMVSQMNRHGGNKLNVEELEKARAWANNQSPSIVNAATGEILGKAVWRGTDFKTASELALKYNDAADNDDVLVAFLKNPGGRDQNIDEALKLIEKIKDPAVRAEISSMHQYKKEESDP